MDTDASGPVLPPVTPSPAMSGSANYAAFIIIVLEPLFSFDPNLDAWRVAVNLAMLQQRR